MKLTPQHITQLYTFTRQHYVEFYDLQTELVDHLANDIEQIWAVEPKISFEDARDKAFKKFGIFGFMDVVEQKQGALNKKYYKLIFKEIKTYFKLPKIILTLFAVWLVYELFQSFNSKYFALIPFLTALTVLSINWYKERKQIKIREKQTGKKWLLDQMLLSLGGFIHIINFILQMVMTPINAQKTLSPITNLVFAVMLVLVCLIVYVAVSVVGPNLRVKLNNEHPEYLLIN